MEKRKATETEKEILNTFEELFPLMNEESKKKLLQTVQGAYFFKTFQERMSTESEKVN